ncbi:hypothetical protein ACKLNO_02095 [Neisseriaceae bacterium B1]
MDSRLRGNDEISHFRFAELRFRQPENSFAKVSGCLILVLTDTSAWAMSLPLHKRFQAA